MAYHKGGLDECRCDVQQSSYPSKLCLSPQACAHEYANVVFHLRLVAIHRLDLNAAKDSSGLSKDTRHMTGGDRVRRRT
jgi:hypothetical protein